MATVKISEQTYKKLNEIAGELRSRLGRPVSVDEAIDYAMRQNKAKPSDYAGSGTLNKFYYFYLLTVFRLYVSIVAASIIGRYKLDFILERETSFGAGGLASLFTGKPIILEIIGPRYSRYSASRAKKILYYTETMLRNWVDRRKCISVPAGVNLDLFKLDEEKGKDVRSSLGFHDAFVLGYVGSFQPWHGIDTLLNAARAARDKIPDLRLLLIGPNYEAYVTAAKELGVSDIAKFLGPMDYDLIPGYTNACDVMLALYEPKKDQLREKYGIGWPIKILEYMACGKPTVSTNVEPVPKIITSPEYGYLLEPGDSIALSQLIISMRSNHDRLVKIGKNGRDLVVENYSWARVARTISELMKEAGNIS